MAKGTSSLMSNAVGGTFGAAHKITGTLGKGLASLSLDQGYQRERARRRLHQAEDVGDGIYQVGGFAIRHFFAPLFNECPR